MFRKTNLPELLAPAGDIDCLYAAVAAGADAVYVGGKRFGARAFAKNFELDELRQAVRYCRLHGVKLYVTLNTLIEDREMADAVAYAAELYRIGVDALIVADLGVMAAIKRYVPGLELHASTQMFVHNSLGAAAAFDLGASRAVLARELTLREIRSAVENSPCEIEVFLHGALCVCYSGQCLFSSLVGGRSGNRGECAQPCRLPYNGGKYPLSLRDLSLADHIPALIESGVASLKIEGRMKNPEYVYSVVSVYRRLLDENRSATPAENELLRRAFSRGGFTDGYLTGKTEKNMTGIRSESDKQDSRSLAPTFLAPKKARVFATAEFRLGKPSKMTITDGTRSVSAYGDIPVPAENSPLTVENVGARLCKMGNTNLSLAPEDITLEIDGEINLPPSAINALRRNAVMLFESCERELPPFEYEPKKSPKFPNAPAVSAQFMSEEGFASALENNEKMLSGIDIAFLSLASNVELLVRAGGVYLPPVCFDSETKELRKKLEIARKNGVMYALVSNIGQIALAKELGFRLVGDFRLNVTNGESADIYRRMGIEHLILSPELTLPKARDIGGGLITYGRIPLMITERCFIRENFGCKNCASACLTDRKGEKFPIMREEGHRNLILNSLPTYMGDRRDELSSNRLTSTHLIFTVEGGEEICNILKSHNEGASLVGRVRRIGRR